MRSSTDALRSLKKYVGEGLRLGTGWDDWEVRLAWEEGTFKRPFARVGFAGPEQSRGSAYIRDVVRPFNILCHPPEAHAADFAMVQATEVGSVLSDLFERGIRFTEPSVWGDVASTPVEVRGYALRIPLWDFDGVPLDGGTAKRTPRDHLRIMDLSVNDVQDPIDDRRRAVACDVRLAWRRMGQPEAGGPLAQGVRVRSEVQ